MIKTLDKATILIVGDEQTSRKDIKKIFAPDYLVLEAKSGKEAMDLLRGGAIVNLIILALQERKQDGLAVIEQLGKDDNLSSIPIIIITENDNSESQNRALSLGAVDVISIPFDSKNLLLRVNRILGLMNTARMLEENKWLTEKQRISLIDTRTGIYNKHTFCKKAEYIISSNPAKKYVLVRFDIDRFKIFNETYGITEGDKLLLRIGEYFKKNKKLDGSMGLFLYGHWDADHFILLWDAEQLNPEKLYTYALNRISRIVPGYSISIHFGFYLVDDPNNMDIAAACDRAYLALKSVKDSYEIHYAWYDDSMRAEVVEEHEIIAAMQEAVQKQQFVLYFQPQYNYCTNQMIGSEVLVRWKHPKMGLIPPSKFIPIFEKSGFIFELDKYIWEKACKYIRSWLTRGNKVQSISVAVNISRCDVNHPQFISYLRRLMSKYPEESSMLRLEITESAYMQDPERLIDVVNELKRMGFHVEMDDFGSGYSSLNMLKDVPVDMLKLDMRFLYPGKNNSRGGSILSSVIRMASSIEMSVIAEGVETRQQADFLKSIGCRYMQGYYFAKPMPAEDFEAILFESEEIADAEERFKTTVDGAADFLDAATQSTLLFNSFVGGAAIIEYANGNVSAIRLNDQFFEALGVTREDYEKNRYDILARLTPETRSTYIQMLETAVKSGEEASCTSCSYPLNEWGEPIWVHNRVRCLAEKADAFILYLSIENITESIKHAHQNEMYRNIILNLSIGVAVYELGDRIYPKYVNNLTCKMLGYTREEYDEHVIKDIQIFSSGNNLGISDEICKRFNEGERIMIPRLCSKKKDGSKIWVRIVAQRIEKMGQSPLCYASLVDISDEIEAEEKYTVQQHELSTLINSIPGGLAIFQAYGDGSVVRKYLSEGAFLALGYEHGEEPRSDMMRGLDRVYPDDLPLVKRIIKESTEKKQPFNFDMRIITKHDGIRWVNLKANPAVTNDGILTFYGVYSDVTQRRETEEKLRIIEKEYRTIAAQSGKLFYRYDIKRRVFEPSTQDTKVFNSPGNSLNAESIAKESMDDWQALLDAIYRGDERGRTEIMRKDSDGQYRWYSVAFTGIHGSDGEPVSAILICEDITDEREGKKKRAFERDGLLTTLSLIYPVTMACNISKNSYYMLGYQDIYNHSVPSEGYFDNLIDFEASTMPPEDSELFRNTFSRQSLLDAFACGKNMLKLEHRQYYKDGLTHWTETVALLVDNVYDDDLLEIVVARNIDEQKVNEEKMKQTLETTSGELAERIYYGKLIERIAPGLMTVCYGSGQPISYISGSLFQQIGYTTEELGELLKIGSSIVLEEDRAALNHIRTEAKSSKIPSYQVEYRVRKKDGGVAWLLQHSIRFTDGKGADGYITLIVDNTEQRQLSERLRMSEEETRFTMAQMGKMIAFYDIKTRTLNVPKQYADKYLIQEMISHIPGNPDMDKRFKKDIGRKVYNAFYEAILQGDASGKADIQFVLPDGAPCWEHVEFVNIFNAEGKAARAVISIEDTTAEHEKAAESQRLRENERIMRAVAEHSERIVYYFDSCLNVAHGLDVEQCEKAGLPAVCAGLPECGVEKGLLMPDSVDSFFKFFEALLSGKSSGEAKINLKGTWAAPRWFDIRFTAVQDKDGKAEGAVLSLLDITAQHDQELSYVRYLQAIDENKAGPVVYIETDLTSDIVEKAGGELLPRYLRIDGLSHTKAVDMLLETAIEEADRDNLKFYFSREHLLSIYSEDRREITSDFKIKPEFDNDIRWVHVVIQFVKDPYSEHIKMFTIIRDNTRQKESELETLRQAELDGLTGIFNRTTTESHIKGHLNAPGSKGGIMIILDIDNFKQINDTLGHAQGDRALVAIAGCLKMHFRESDIVGRIGGDEFLVFLQNAVNTASLTYTLTSMLRKLSTIPVGENDEQYIHCSAGCALYCQGEDNFDSLYKKADTALYHVKRGGKNDYAFYDSNMQLANYQYQGHANISLRHVDMFDQSELRHLVRMLSQVYPLVASVNLTNNSYYLMESRKDILLNCPESGRIEEILKAIRKQISPEDCRRYFANDVQNRLLDAFGNGRTMIQFHCRQIGKGSSSRLVEVVLLLYRNDDGDVCVFFLARPSDNVFDETNFYA